MKLEDFEILENEKELVLRPHHLRPTELMEVKLGRDNQGEYSDFKLRCGVTARRRVR